MVLALPSKVASSSWRLTAITFTNVVFPEYWRPTRVSSISSFQNRDLIQSKNRFISASILKPVVTLSCRLYLCLPPWSDVAFSSGQGKLGRRQLSYDHSRAKCVPQHPHCHREEVHQPPVSYTSRGCFQRALTSMMTPKDCLHLVC